MTKRAARLTLVAFIFAIVGLVIVAGIYFVKSRVCIESKPRVFASSQHLIFSFVSRQCSVLGEDEIDTIAIANRRSIFYTKIFQYRPTDGEIPSIVVNDNQVNIRISRIDNVLSYRNSWNGYNINFSIGKIFYPSGADPRELTR